MIHIIIADDHKIFRDGLKMLLESIQNLKVIGEASTGIELLEILENKVPDIIFMDIKMPEMDGIEASRNIRIRYPDIKIITLTMYGDEKYYREMDDAGVKNFVLKDSESEELELAINAVTDNKNYVAQSFLQKLIREKLSNGDIKIPKLTKREQEVLSFLAKGLTNEEIAEKLYLSKRTIERHRAKLLEKTNTKNSVSLITFAIKNNLVKIDDLQENELH